MKKEGRKMQREAVLEFRTPQHPCLGTNNWGGSSPLLARNIPKESLEQKYSMLNSVRTRDEIFPVHEYHFNDASTKKPGSRRGILLKLMSFGKDKKTATLGSNLKKRRWLPRLDPQNRWPQGWC